MEDIIGDKGILLLQILSSDIEETGSMPLNISMDPPSEQEMERERKVNLMAWFALGVCIVHVTLLVLSLMEPEAVVCETL